MTTAARFNGDERHLSAYISILLLFLRTSTQTNLSIKARLYSRTQDAYPNRSRSQQQSKFTDAFPGQRAPLTVPLIRIHSSVLLALYLSFVLQPWKANELTIVAAFTGIITAVAAWAIWKGEVFPAEKDPSGGTSFSCGRGRYFS